ncbi:MAG: hypothetical protein ACOC44_10530 [Promethearchaeia archaeon]
MTKLEEIPQYRNKNRDSYIGLCGHPIIEDIFRKDIKTSGNFYTFFIEPFKKK